jgi:hypothetical protein
MGWPRTTRILSRKTSVMHIRPVDSVRFSLDLVARGPFSRELALAIIALVLTSLSLGISSEYGAFLSGYTSRRIVGAMNNSPGQPRKLTDKIVPYLPREPTDDRPWNVQQAAKFLGVSP